MNAIRTAGLKARDELIERISGDGTPDNDLADYMERIVDACVNAADELKEKLFEAEAILEESPNMTTDTRTEIAKHFAELVDEYYANRDDDYAETVRYALDEFLMEHMLYVKEAMLHYAERDN